MAEGRTRRELKVVVSSCLAYAVGALLAWLTYLVGLAGFGWIEGREPAMGHAEVIFRAAGPMLADAGGLLAVIGLGVVLLAVLPGPGPHGVARLTVLWTMLHLFLVALLRLVLAPFRPEGIGATLAGQMGIPDTFMWILAAVAAVAVIGMGLAAGPFFLKFAPARRLVEERPDRARFGLMFVGLPWLIGSIIVYFTLRPTDDLLLSIGLAAVVVVFAITAMTAAVVGPKWDPTMPAWPIVPAVLLAVLIWVFGFGLRAGIDIPPWG
jgi:hypothetical protein